MTCLGMFFYYFIKLTDTLYILWFLISCNFNLLFWNLKLFSWWMHHLYLHHQCTDVFFCCCPHQLSGFDDSHPNRHEVASCCGFGFHSLDNRRCWAPVPVAIRILSSEKIQALCSCFYWGFAIILLLSCRHSAYSLATDPWSYMWFSMFPPLLCPLLCLVVSFTVLRPLDLKSVCPHLSSVCQPHAWSPSLAFFSEEFHDFHSYF